MQGMILFFVCRAAALLLVRLFRVHLLDGGALADPGTDDVGCRHVDALVPQKTALAAGCRIRR